MRASMRSKGAVSISGTVWLAAMTARAMSSSRASMADRSGPSPVWARTASTACAMPAMRRSMAFSPPVSPLSILMESSSSWPRMVAISGSTLA